jgi:hypothetical protein
MKHEKTQKKNPHHLVVNQHVFPSKSISRFTNTNCMVSVCDKKNQVERLAKPNDIIFCARRSWDQKSEKGYMLEIENDFQALADRILDNNVCKIRNENKNIINFFYALWYMRSRYRNLNEQEIQMKGVTGYDWTKDQEEIFEKSGCAFIRKGGKAPARVINGMKLKMLICDYAVNVLCGTSWGIIHAQDGEFVVPDITSQTIIPLNPRVCLASPSSNGIIVKNNVAEINRALVYTSHEYYFARNFTNCPL